MKFKPKEFWRDIEAFGSFTFYAAVMARSLVGLDWAFFGQLIAALAFSQILLRLIGNAMRQKISSHAANGGVLLVLVNVFYQSKEFFVFSAVLYLLVCISHQKLREHGWAEVITGLVIGLLSAGLAWWLTPLIF
jgi:hypothetical protein